jgi:hypothetical protein
MIRIDNGIVFDFRALESVKQNRVELIRFECTNEIQKHADNYSQQNAALGIYSAERCEAIKSYIAACRNEYLRCKSLILAAQTNDKADAVQFVAPTVPSGL